MNKYYKIVINKTGVIGYVISRKVVSCSTLAAVKQWLINRYTKLPIVEQSIHKNMPDGTVKVVGFIYTHYGYKEHVTVEEHTVQCVNPSEYLTEVQQNEKT